MAARQWTDEQRKAQAEAIKKIKPWELSTGPKTTKGKKQAAKNGRKNAHRVSWTRDDAEAWIKSIRGELLADKVTIDRVLNRFTSKGDAPPKSNQTEPIIRLLTRSLSAIRKAKKSALLITDLKTAKRYTLPTVDTLCAVQKELMDACDSLFLLVKTLERERLS